MAYVCKKMEKFVDVYDSNFGILALDISEEKNYNM